MPDLAWLHKTCKLRLNYIQYHLNVWVHPSTKNKSYNHTFIYPSNHPSFPLIIPPAIHAIMEFQINYSYNVCNVWKFPEVCTLTQSCYWGIQAIALASSVFWFFLSHIQPTKHTVAKLNHVVASQGWTLPKRCIWAQFQVSKYRIQNAGI